MNQDIHEKIDPAADPGMVHHQELNRRFGNVRALRPGVLATLLLKILGPYERRRIVTTDAGIRLYMDPFNHLGQAILHSRRYEPETEAMLRDHVRPGHTFLDVGANEGYFSALAATLVGPTGFVMSLEPQTTLCDLIEINVRLNGGGAFRVFNNALGGPEGEIGVLNVWPAFNSGASSIVSRYRFSRAVQEFRYVSVDTLFAACRRQIIDFVKIDVEGFEARVAASLIPHVAAGRIGRVLLDYHEPMLRRHGVDPTSIHEALLGAGCRIVAPKERRLNGYVLYEHAISRS